MPTGIPWCDETINPIRTPDGGYHCTKISEGCAHCYAEPMNKRFGNGLPFDNTHTEFQLNYKQLYKPLHWEKQRRVFIQSMGDLFHEDVPDELRDEIFSIILGCSVLNNRPHTFMVLTKRPELMTKYFTDRDPLELIKTWADRGDGHIQMDNPDICFSETVYSATCRDWDKNGRNSSGSEHKPWGYLKNVWPLPNLWLGVTAENQARADERIPLLLQTPAAVRFVSVEPMLGPVDIARWLLIRWQCSGCRGYFNDPYREICPDCGRKNYWSGSHRYNGRNMPRGPICPSQSGRGLDLVINGGESGPGARPMHPDWVRSLRDQCVAAGTPFYFKQWGEWLPNAQEYGANPGNFNYEKRHMLIGDVAMCKAGKKKAGRLLDGQEWLQMPEASS